MRDPSGRGCDRSAPGENGNRALDLFEIERLRHHHVDMQFFVGLNIFV